MCELFSASTYFFAALTVVVFALASACQKKLKLVIFNPVLVSVLVIIGLLTVLEGELTLAWQGGCRKTAKGESLYVPAASPALTLTGNGRAALSMPR